MSYSNFAEMREALLDRAGESPTDTAGGFYAASSRELVRSGRELARYHPWLFLRKYPPGAFVTVAPYTTGTITVTKGSTAATLSPAPGAGLGSFKDRKLTVANWEEFYRIAAHTAGSGAITLDVAWQGADQSGVTFTIYQDEYSLATDANHIEWMGTADDGDELTPKSEAWVRREYREPISGSWPPLYFARIGQTRIRLVPPPLYARRIEYAYTSVMPDLDAPNTAIVVPTHYLHIPVDGALYFIHLMKEDNRADAAGILFGKGLDRMVEDDQRLRLLTGTSAKQTTGPYDRR